MTGRVRPAVVVVAACLCTAAVALGEAGKSEDLSSDPRSAAAVALGGETATPGPASDANGEPAGLRRINAASVNDPSHDSTENDTQSETSVLVDGANVVAAWNDSGSLGNRFTGYGNSTNAGTTFTDQAGLELTTEGDGGDPVLAGDDQTHTIFLATLGFNTGERIQVFKSTDGGANFGDNPVNGTPGWAGTGGNEFEDKPWITVDNFAGTGRHNVYLCWTRFNTGVDQIRFTRSTNGGANFGPNRGLLLSPGGQGCFVAVGPNHEVYVFYYRGTGPQGQGGDNKLWVRKSIDRGVSFSPEVQVADLNTTTTNGSLGLNGGLRSNSFPHAAVNPVSGHIVVVWNDDPNLANPNDNSDVFLSKSRNGGSTWTAPVQVNEDGAGDQFFPTVSITPLGSRIMLGYYSRSHDPANFMFHRRGRAGTMHNATGAIALKRSFQLGADAPIVIGQDPKIKPDYMGDYDTIDSNSSFFYSTWSDNREPNAFGGSEIHANQPDVYIAQINASGVAQAANLIVNVVPAASSVNRGSSVDVAVNVTANGALARDVYISLAPATGLLYRNATGGDCDVVDGFVGCSVGDIAAGATKTVHVTTAGKTAGSRTVRAAATTSSAESTPANNSDTAPLAVNAIPTATQTFSTGNIAVAINDNSTVNVPLTIGPPGPVLDVDALVRLNHTFDGDLDLSLISPAGDTVELSTDNGGGGDNYGSGTNNCSGTSTRFDDSSATAITAGAAPFAGSFKPEGTLEDFFGTAKNGTWRLRVTDQFGGDTGTVGCFRLRIERPN